MLMRVCERVTFATFPFLGLEQLHIYQIEALEPRVKGDSEEYLSYRKELSASRQSRPKHTVQVAFPVAPLV